MSRPSLERDRLRRVAKRYASDGYEVLIDPSVSQLPEWLGTTTPDALAIRDDDQVVIEVKSRDSLPSDAKLMQLAEAVSARPEWRLELVVTNRRAETRRAQLEELVPAGQLQEHLSAARTLVREGPVQPAFLVAWVTLEGAARHALRTEKVDPVRVGPASLLKTLFSLGYLNGSDELEWLQTLWRVRNELAHGYAPRARIDPEAVETLIEAAARILRHAAETPPDGA